MLVELRVANFALVEKLELEFHQGFNVLTGETGAGKSLLMGALALVTGGKVEPQHLRRGAERGWVEARFDLTRSRLTPTRMEELGLKCEAEHELILRRSILPGGKSRAEANERAVTAATLRRLGASLVDLHGQHEHQWLLDSHRQLFYLDRFAGLGPARARTEAAHRRYRDALASHHEAHGRLAAAREREDLSRFQLRELRSARLRAGEEEELGEERRRLLHAETLRELAGGAHELLYGEESSAHDRIGEAARLLSRAAELDGGLAGREEEVRGAARSLADLADELRRYLEGIEGDPARAQWLEERLAELQTLRRKYKVSSDTELVEIQHRLEEEVKLGEEGEEFLSQARARAEELAEELRRDARRLSGARSKAAGRLAEAVMQEIGEMGMERARFLVSLESVPALKSSRPPSIEDGDPLADIGPEGGDVIEFLLAANVGEEPLPLRSVASGGELSRVMLALKGIIAGADEVDTMVFDEIDLGIGGAAAGVVGTKMKRLGDERQLVCLTHLPQLAARGEHHFRVAKKVTGGRTVVSVKELTDDERLAELSRMLGGTRPSAAAQSHARELLAPEAAPDAAPAKAPSRRSRATPSPSRSSTHRSRSTRPVQRPSSGGRPPKRRRSPTSTRSLARPPGG